MYLKGHLCENLFIQYTMSLILTLFIYLFTYLFIYLFIHLFIYLLDFWKEAKEKQKYSH